MVTAALCVTAAAGRRMAACRLLSRLVGMEVAVAETGSCCLPASACRRWCGGLQEAAAVMCVLGCAGRPAAVSGGCCDHSSSRVAASGVAVHAGAAMLLCNAHYIIVLSGLDHLQQCLGIQVTSSAAFTFCCTHHQIKSATSQSHVHCAAGTASGGSSVTAFVAHPSTTGLLSINQPVTGCNITYTHITAMRDRCSCWKTFRPAHFECALTNAQKPCMQGA